MEQRDALSSVSPSPGLVTTSASPWDWVKAGAGAADRAATLGLNPRGLNESYGLNQSFPRASVTSQQRARRLESPGLISLKQGVS